MEMAEGKKFSTMLSSVKLIFEQAVLFLLGATICAGDFRSNKF